MTGRRVVRWGGIAIGVALLTVATTAPAQRVTWGGSLGYSQGTYIFSETFRSLSLLNSLTLSTGRLDVTVALPLLGQNGSVVSYVAGVPVPTGGPDNGAVQRRKEGQAIPVRPGRRGGSSQQVQGVFASVLVADSVADSMSVAGTGTFEVHVGDPVFGASLAAFEGAGAVRTLGVDVWTKVPVSSVESGVGSGAWDYGAGASLVLGAGKSLLFANATWWVLGDMPDLELQDALFYSVAVARPIGDVWSVMTSASASTRIIAGSSPPVSANLMFSRSLSDGASVSINAGLGLTESASDVSLGLGWATRLLGDRR